jgi:hypothetical protein
MKETAISVGYCVIFRERAASKATFRCRIMSLQKNLTSFQSCKRARPDLNFVEFRT